MATAREAGLSGIASFAKGLEQDLDAVTNGLTMNWNSGPVEGRVNHIKMIKRQMSGRADLPLLRSGSSSPPSRDDQPEWNRIHNEMWARSQIQNQRRNPASRGQFR